MLRLDPPAELHFATRAGELDRDETLRRIVDEVVPMTETETSPERDGAP